MQTLLLLLLPSSPAGRVSRREPVSATMVASPVSRRELATARVSPEGEVFFKTARREFPTAGISGGSDVVPQASLVEANQGGVPSLDSLEQLPVDTVGELPLDSLVEQLVEIGEGGDHSLDSLMEQLLVDTGDEVGEGGDDLSLDSLMEQLVV